MAIPPTCQGTFAKLSPYVDGELPPKERTSVEQHLSTCPACTARVADLRASSGLLRVGLDMLSDEVDFKNFSQTVMARITPERPPLWERIKADLAERFTYQRGALMGGFAGVAVAAAAVFVLAHGVGGGMGGTPAQVAVDAVTTDETAHVAPVVMKTEQGTIIWLVDHADKSAVGAPSTVKDAGVSTPPPPSTPKSDGRPKGGDL